MSSTTTLRSYSLLSALGALGDTDQPKYLDVDGDGLFLPVHWWHAVQARPRDFGITVPLMWNSPFRDLRQPAQRHLLRRLWRRRKPLGAKELLASTYGTVATVVRDQLPR